MATENKSGGWLSYTSLIFTLVTMAGGAIYGYSQLNATVTAQQKVIEEYKVHTTSTNIHIDPARDERRWGDLIRRLEKIEEKLDNIATMRDNASISRRTEYVAKHRSSKPSGTKREEPVIVRSEPKSKVWNINQSLSQQAIQTQTQVPQGTVTRRPLLPSVPVTKSSKRSGGPDLVSLLKKLFRMGDKDKTEASPGQSDSPKKSRDQK
jgi:hypothetical protein